MLHPKLAKGICSLNPGVDRLTKTVVMDIDKDGKIVDYKVQKSVINSKMKMVYEDVDEVLKESKKAPPEYLNFKKEIFTLYDAAMRLEKRYTYHNGKLTFASNEMEYVYNSDGSIKRQFPRESSLSRKIIENLMIAAGITVAEFISNLGFPMVYRVHEFPNIEEINNALIALRKQGYKTRILRDNDPHSLQKVLNNLSMQSGFNVISQMIVMKLKRARYSIINLGHYALGLLMYCHFTSPIRRLADLLVHTILDVILEHHEKIDKETIKMYEELFKNLAKHASDMERQADAAEHLASRKSVLHKLEKNMDQVYEANVVEVGSRIMLSIDGVLTSIKAHDLDSVFAYNRKKKYYYDRETNERIRVGTTLAVKLKSVSAYGEIFNVSVIGLADIKETNEVDKKVKTLSRT